MVRSAKAKLKAARSLENAGKPDAAAAYYREVIVGLPASPQADEAQARLKALDSHVEELETPAGKARRVEPPARFKKATAYKVARVIDGDTVVLVMHGGTVKVGLIGVDTPESVHPSKPVERSGREASKFLNDLLGGQSVYVDYDPGGNDLDLYGRLLAYLYRAPDGLFINREIIAKGYGHADVKYPFQYMEDFRATERAAREAKVGLWADERAVTVP